MGTNTRQKETEARKVLDPVKDSYRSPIRSDFDKIFSLDRPTIEEEIFMLHTILGILQRQMEKIDGDKSWQLDETEHFFILHRVVITLEEAIREVHSLEVINAIDERDA